ncbi:hypothetical protein R1sor_018132 [Riccia sorocarpa]|uniref:Protein kinase domain-containing protein n=1 Tax=Riccia sorocarpa TaxID=122646 RepID=A0ABD3I8T2_9MARC
MRLTHRVGVFDDHEELAQVLGGHKNPIQRSSVESHPAIIRPIGPSKDKKMHMILFPLWNGGTLEKYMNLEKRSRGQISLEGVRLVNEDFRDSVTADEWLNIQIFNKHRLQIAGTMVTGLKFMHLRKYLHCDIHYQNVLLRFPSWDWNETKVMADFGRNNENKPIMPIIRCSLVFVGIGDLGKT